MTDKTDEQEIELDSPEMRLMAKSVREQIITARIGLLMRHPWFGNMATRLRVQEANNWCPTAATNGRDLFYSVPFFNDLSLDEIEFVIGHEILHCVLDHIARGHGYNQQLFNIACDFLVNNILVRDKIGTPPKKIDIYQDFKYDGWTAEEVYEDLFKKAKDELDQLGELLDDHIDWDNPPEGSGQPSISRSELNQIRDEIKESMISAASASGAGNVPAEIRRMITELTEPKMNWRDILQQQIQSTVRNDYSFMRPNRKSQSSGTILPGMNYDNTIEITVALDMSGSISDVQARDFISEVKGIMDQYADYQIDIMTFDTKVYNHLKYSLEQNNDISEYPLEGGGGTRFDCVFEYLQENGIIPRKLLIFSDMYDFGNFGDDSYCDTIFINHGRPGFEAPFGLTIPYSFEK